MHKKPLNKSMTASWEHDILFRGSGQDLMKGHLEYVHRPKQEDLLNFRTKYLS